MPFENNRSKSAMYAPTTILIAITIAAERRASFGVGQVTTFSSPITSVKNFIGAREVTKEDIRALARVYCITALTGPQG